MTAGRLEFVGFVDLPAPRRPGGFDYAAVHRRSGRVYVAHTANDAIDVIDGLTYRYVGSIPDLIGVAGAPGSPEHDLGFTSNRGGNTVGSFVPPDRPRGTEVGVRVRPNGPA